MAETDGAALYLFATDILDEGVDRVIAEATRLGLSTLAVTLAYHQARDVLPHAGDKPRIRYRRDGVFFEPNPPAWENSRIRPIEQDAELQRAAGQLLARRDDIGVESWTVFLHNTGLAERHPDLASVTCFGDAILSNLCPANPDVAAYSAALAGDISARGVDVIAEALSGQTFAHGHHHERSFTPIGAGDEAILALCFCPHCESAANEAGIDVERLSAAARVRVQRAYGGAAPLPATIPALAESLGDDLPGYLRVQQAAVTALAERVGATVRGNGQRLSFMDLTGAVLGYGDGAPSGAPAAEQAWRLRIDPGEVALHADSYSILGYVSDPERLAVDVASYRELIGATPLRVILRPGFPDTGSGEVLQAKVDAAMAAGADQVDFYNYGMYDDAVLSRIPAALSGA
jgi:hypothetical protein